MRLTTSIFALLLQCVSPASFAAKGHTINNGGNLAEIRFTEVWKNFEALMAPCLTPQNLCSLTPAQLSMLRTAVQTKPVLPPLMPSAELLYRADGSAKSRGEILEVALSLLQDCGPSLTALALHEISARALEFQSFQSLTLSGGETWFVFDRGGLQIEDSSSVRAFSPDFRSLLRLDGTAALSFTGLHARPKGSLVEISGQVTYSRGMETSRAFSLLLAPQAGGKIPVRPELVIY